MSRIYIPTLGPTDWRGLLADPQRHWVRKKSAFELAVSWDFGQREKRGLPLEVAQALDSHPRTKASALVFGVPEHKVQLEGGGRSSQNDLWALLRTNRDLISMTVEGKSGEPFDKKVAEWLQDMKPASRKRERLQSLLTTLDLGEVNVDSIRYQLLHRTVSAIVEARRCGATVAVMLVQSFGGNADAESFKDFQAFACLMGIQAKQQSARLTPRNTQVPLLLGWVNSNPSSDRIIARTVG